MTNLIDPIHFFDERGRPVRSFEEIEKKLHETEAELERYKELCASLQRKVLARNEPKEIYKRPTLH